MADDQAIPLLRALSQEYDALRPKSGYADCPDSELFSKVHADPTPFSALCISGGGIRSATFAFGVIQGLAEHGLLTAFDYLSTVSGGGYIGGWLTCWKQRMGGLDNILPYLRRRAPSPPPGEPDPIGHLREYNSYLSPKLGFFSADTWTLAGTVVRNMFLNWLVFLPLLMAALMAPRLALSLARLGDTYQIFYGTSSLPSAPFSAGISILSGLLFATAIFNMMRYLPGLGSRRHTDKDFIKWVLAPIVGAALAYVAGDSWFELRDIFHPNERIGYWPAVAGVNTAALAGWFAWLLVCGKPARERLRLFMGVTWAVLLAGWSASTVGYGLTDYLYPNASWPVYITFAAPLMVLAVVFAGCLFVGFTSRVLKDEDREWLSRAGAWLLLFAAAWSALCALVLIAPGGYSDRWYSSGFIMPGWVKSLLGGVGAVSGAIGALAGNSSKTAARESARSHSRLVPKLVMALAVPVFVVCCLVGLTLATDWLLAVTRLGAAASPSLDYIGAISRCPDCAWWNHQALLEGTRWESILILGAAFILFSQVMARFIDINKFSLHAMYRNRLIRAYLGASNRDRQSSPFTGFASNDNIPMAALETQLKPFPIVNVTLNLVSGKRLAWQQRKAESFTISPLHCGSAELAYRPSAHYGGPISLGTAITISGAAASPNMGYHSSALIGFIMTLFNARLGAWLGNPGEVGGDTWRKSGPTSAAGSLVSEAFGLTNDTNPWVYLSDGGHFENLALYEMVRRRCRLIVVLDGGCDAAFGYGDLGNALRKIRIDLKVPIEFDERHSAALGRKEQRYSIARIAYSAVDNTREDGRLLYIKPMIRGNEPPDVASYYCDNPTFPHQSTGDQFFDESQTESYRALGAHTITEILRTWDGADGLAGLLAHLEGPRASAATT